MEVAHYQKMLEFYLPWILNQFDVTDGLTIEITDSDGRIEDGMICYGYYSNRKNLITLCGGSFEGMPEYQILSTLAHELKHAEQYKRKKLQIVKNFYGEWVYKWYRENVYLSCYSLKYADTYEKYYNLPWEIEARETEKIILEKVLKRHNSYNIFRKIRWFFFKPKNIKKLTK